MRLGISPLLYECCYTLYNPLVGDFYVDVVVFFVYQRTKPLFKLPVCLNERYGAISGEYKIIFAVLCFWLIT